MQSSQSNHFRSARRPARKVHLQETLSIACGESTGWRSINRFFNNGENLYFFDMYLKSQLSKKKGKELEDDEIAAYCKIASDFIAMTNGQIEQLLKAKELIEVNCDE
jgi:hypothetical protein